MAAAHSVRSDRRRHKGGENEKIENELDSIEKEVTRLRPRKERLQRCIEDAMGESEALCGCYLEVVGSTSWGGEVPQSDLDLVLCTPQRCLEGREAVAILDELRQVLERRLQAQDEPALRDSVRHIWQWKAKSGWQDFPGPAIKLLEVAYKEKKQVCEVQLPNGPVKVNLISFTQCSAQGIGQERRVQRIQVPDRTGSAAQAERRRDLDQDNVLKRVELVDAARVPILRCVEWSGMSCDVSIDQFRALEHRKFLQEALEGRPEVRSLIRLVKSWLRRRGLPMAAEGGIASLAWAVTALVLSSEQPPGTSVEVLLLHFFSKMHHLGEQSLTVRHRVESDSAADFKWKHVQLKVEWKHRSGPSFCKDEWVRLFFLEDPILAARAPDDRGDRGSASPHFLGVTPPSIPAALAVLYVAELRLAWKSVKEGNWDALWRITHPLPEARSPLPSQLNVSPQKAQKALQMILKEGVVHLGQLLEVRKCPTVQHDAALHRRDQSSELVLQPCHLKKENTTAGPRVYKRNDQPVVCQPCHWICALPMWSTSIMPGDGLSRLAEISTMVQISSLEPGVRLLDVTGQHVQRPIAKSEAKLATGLQDVTKVRPVAQTLPLRTSAMRPGIVNPTATSGDGYPQQAHSDESTRASDRNSDSDDDLQRAAVHGKVQQAAKPPGSLQPPGRAAAPRPDATANVRQAIRATPSSAATSAARGSAFQGGTAGPGAVRAEKYLHPKGAVRAVAAIAPVQITADKPLVGHDSIALPSNTPAKSTKSDVAISAKKASRCFDKVNLDKAWISGKDASKDDKIAPAGISEGNGAEVDAKQQSTAQGRVGIKKDRVVDMWHMDKIDRPPSSRSFASTASLPQPTSNVIQAKSGSNWGLVLALNLDAPMWCRR